MKISNIKATHIFNFGAFQKEPTQNGYKTYDDGILTKDSSFDIKSKTLTEDTFDKNGNKTHRNISIYPMGTITNIDYEYNPNGQMTRSVIKDASGEIVHETVRKYNDNGKLKSEKQRDYVGDISYSTHCDCTGRKLSTTVKFADSIETTRYIYNQNGLLQNEITYDKNNKKMQTVEYEYGWYKKPVRITHYDDKSNIVYEELYDERTGKILKTLYNRNDSQSATEYFYDAKGENLMFKTTSVKGVETSFTRYRYNSDNKLEAAIELKDGKVSNVIQYDPETGNISKTITYKQNGTDYDANIYEYDEYGRGVSCLYGNKSGKLANMYAFDYDSEQFVEFKP